MSVWRGSLVITERRPWETPPPAPSSAVEIWGPNGRGDFQELLILSLSWRVSDAVCLVPTAICKVRVRGANPP